MKLDAPGLFDEPREILLTDYEIHVLCNTPNKGNGGFQRLINDLKSRTGRDSRVLTINKDHIERIRRYAFDYGQGGWEDRLKAIFKRTLGERLDGKI